MANNNGTGEVLALWEAFKPQVNALIDEKTKNCIRALRATVTTVADTTTGKMGVQFPFEDNVIQLPYSTAIAGATVGSQVWVIVPYGGNDLSNGVVVQNGTWTL